jgi:hypothetical protein
MVNNGKSREVGSSSLDNLNEHQMIHRLWKQFEDLNVEERRLRIAEEIKKLEIPDEVRHRILRDYT